MRKLLALSQLFPQGCSQCCHHHRLGTRKLLKEGTHHRPHIFLPKSRSPTQRTGIQQYQNVVGLGTKPAFSSCDDRPCLIYNHEAWSIIAEICGSTSRCKRAENTLHPHRMLLLYSIPSHLATQPKIPSPAGFGVVFHTLVARALLTRRK